MTLDFRASQIRTNKLIASGSTGTNAILLIYPFSSALNQSGSINTGFFSTSSIGQDVFMFVSGAINSADTTTRGITAFGGDVKVSGTFQVLSISAFYSPSAFVSSASFFAPVSILAPTLVSSSLTVFGGITGSLQRLADGTQYLYGSAGVRINSQSNGAVAISGSTGIYGRLPMAGFVMTTNTSSSPQIAGQNAWSPTEWAYVSGAMGVYLKAVVSTFSGAQLVYLKLYNITAAAYVEIGGVGITALSSSATTPTKILSSNLVSAANFSTNSEQIYELQLYSSTGSNLVVLGSAEILTIPN